MSKITKLNKKIQKIFFLILFEKIYSPIKNNPIIKDTFLIKNFYKIIYLKYIISFEASHYCFNILNS